MLRTVRVIHERLDVPVCVNDVLMCWLKYLFYNVFYLTLKISVKV